MKLSLTSVRGVGTTALCRTLHQQALADATNTREVEESCQAGALLDYMQGQSRLLASDGCPLQVPRTASRRLLLKMH